MFGNPGRRSPAHSKKFRLDVVRFMKNISHKRQASLSSENLTAEWIRSARDTSSKSTFARSCGRARNFRRASSEKARRIAVNFLNVIVSRMREISWIRGASSCSSSSVSKFVRTPAGCDEGALRFTTLIEVSVLREAVNRRFICPPEFRSFARRRWRKPKRIHV